jgi:murein DD-endopeptidase MepM/ murein hydrolase activator NlpD
MKKWWSLFAFLILSLVSFSFAKPPVRKSSVHSAARSLAFPVAGKKSNIGDRWGANRDGGRRKHKGIDIFARKGTPVVAISDGVIVERNHTAIGGKTLWLKSSHSWTAYYAHLDKQMVREGQHVKKGHVIGTVGNTGNARTTPSHLHFGISKRKAWVNPLPYVKNSQKIVAKVPKKKAPATKNAKRKYKRR